MVFVVSSHRPTGRRRLNGRPGRARGWLGNRSGRRSRPCPSIRAASLAGLGRGVVLPATRGRAGPAHPVQSSAGSAARASAIASTSGSTAPAGTSQPFRPGSTSSGMPAIVRRDHRAAQGHRLHDHHRQALGEAGQHQGPRGLQLAADPVVVQEPGDPHVVPQADAGRSAARARPRIGPSPTMTSSKSGRRSLQPRRGLDQQELALLLGQPAHVHQPRPIRDGRAARRQEDLVQAAADHVDLRPVARRAPPAELAAGEVADRDDERRRGGPSRPGPAAAVRRIPRARGS